VPCQAGAQRVQNEILNHWPDDTYNAGCFNPNSVLDGTNTPSDHALGEAIDIGIEPDERGRVQAGQAIFNFMWLNRSRLGLKQLIWDGQIWSATNQPNLIRPYTANPHRDHIHASFFSAAARNPALTAKPFPGGAGADPTAGYDEPMTLAELGAIGAHIDASANRVIGTLQKNMKEEFIPAIVAGVSKATGVDPKVISKAVADELAKNLLNG
jgi:hypothetical protein